MSKFFLEMSLLRQSSPVNIWLTHSELAVIIEQLDLISSDPINVNNPMGKETYSINSYLRNIYKLQECFGMESIFEKYKIKIRPCDVVVILTQLSLASTYEINANKQEVIKMIMHSLIDSIKSILELIPGIRRGLVNEKGDLQRWSNQ